MVKENLSEKSAKSFQEKLSATIVKIIKTPTAGKVSAKRRDVRSALVTKYNKLYYRLSEDTITLLELFETKQDPAKNKYE